MPKLKFEYKITIAYFLIGGAWIIFSDKLLDYFIESKQTLTELQTFKGWFYVIITAILLFLFLKNHLEKLRQAQKKAEESDQLKTAFLHNITHEIRTPMNSIIGFSELLNDPELSFEKRQFYSELIAQSCNRLLALITDIVNIATIEAGQEKVIDNEINLNALLQQIHEKFQPSAQANGIVLSYNYSLADEEVIIKTDREKLAIILANLLSNAIKFTHNGIVNFGYIKKDNFLEFYVKDTGIGIPSDQYNELFKRFRQLDNKIERQFSGSGLGLAITKSYVELLGGKIWFTSEEGQGSIFYFSIPCQRETLANLLDDKNKIDSKIKTTKPTTILVAEDEEINFVLLNEMLSDSNLTILHASNGVEAVEICKSNQSIDLVLMDIKMPIMDGHEATELIKEIRPSLPVIAQTAYSSDLDKAKAMAAGCSDFISKPIYKDQLISKINKLLKG